MSTTSLLPQRCKIIQAFAPQHNAGGITGDWVSMKGYDACTIILHLGSTTAVDAAGAITVDKAVDVAGTSPSTGMVMRHVWRNLDATTVDANQGELVKDASATQVTVAVAASQVDKIYVIEIPAASLLDTTALVGDKYDCIRVVVGVTHANNFISAQYILHEARYQEEPMRAATTD
jgi:hypothetical protein